MQSLRSCRVAGLAIFAVLFSQFSSPLYAGGGFFRNGAVGGVAIDASGVLSQPTVEATQSLVKAMQGRMTDVPAEAAQSTEMRKISLRQINAAIEASATKEVRDLPDEIKYLAGIQRIKYVFLYPEKNDIVLAGPGEGWTLDQAGNVVGETSGQPVCLLEDLIVALRSSEMARQGGISCSIDPRPEGVVAMRNYLDGKSYQPQVLDGIAQSLGDQMITVTGVPQTSHLARVLVAADYRMKRIAMGLEDSPIADLASFLSMMQSSRTKLTNMMPRWWLATDYAPLSKSEDGLAWELRGQGVKAMTEDSFMDANGVAQQAGKANPIAQQWADDMTKHFEALSKQEAIFGQLRNAMDMCVIAALIQNEGMLETVGCELPMIYQSTGAEIEVLNAPKSVGTQCSVMKRGRDYIITASGGVSVDSWQAATTSQVSPRLSNVRSQVEYKPEGFWWN